uniref:Alpha-L-rhamnosidase n=1 Tax=Hanusia phi TaxID=3032 RepID=A0A7S0EXJ9_9CRYP
MLARPLRPLVYWSNSIMMDFVRPQQKLETYKKEDGSAVVVLKFLASHGVQERNLTIIMTWAFSLAPDSRHVLFQSHGNVDDDVRAFLFDVKFTPMSITGIYSGGIEQMMYQNDWQAYFPSSDDLLEVFAAGPKDYGCIEVIRQSSLRVRDGKSSNLSTCLFSSTGATGLQEIVVGRLKNVDRWTTCDLEQEDFRCSKLPCFTSFSHSWMIFPNEWSYPVSAVIDDKTSQGVYSFFELSEDGLAKVSSLEMISSAISIYTNLVGILNSHRGSVVDGEQIDQIATGIRHPDRGYQDMYNFFDPDSFFSVQALLLSGSRYIHEQVRRVIERSGFYICMNSTQVCSKGQVPHHFVKDQPVFHAISGERQTGPNVFWILTSIEFAKITANYTWISQQLPLLRTALEYLLNGFDEDVGLIWADGSLMIDTFRRVGFTSDTNAIIIHLLQEFADVEQKFGNESLANQLRTISATIKKSFNQRLWRDDHVATSIDREGNFVDFVDYDSNLMAIALNATDSEEKDKKILERIDSNPLAARVPTWVSEVIYEGEMSRPKGGTADSVCGMARIAWFNALARRKLDLPRHFRFFLHNLLTKISSDLLDRTWLPERYTIDGAPQLDRTGFYFEYPAVLLLLLYKILLGVEFGFRSIVIRPWRVNKFRIAFGEIKIHYIRCKHVKLTTHMHGSTFFLLSNMADEHKPLRYSISSSCTGQPANSMQ